MLCFNVTDWKNAVKYGYISYDSSCIFLVDVDFMISHWNVIQASWERERDEGKGKMWEQKQWKGVREKRGTECEMIGESDEERDVGEIAGLR